MSSKTTTRTLLQTYLEETVLQPATIKHITSVAHLFEREIGCLPIQEITRSHIIQWRERVLSRASVRTWNNYLLHMRILCNFGVRIGKIDANPFSLVQASRVTQHRKKIVSPDLLQHALKVLEADDEPIKPGWFWSIVIRTIYYTGIRRRQLVNLRWRDIDFDGHTLMLTASGSKTRREWSIPLLPECVSGFRQLQDMTQMVRGDTPVDPDHQIFNVTLFYPRYFGKEMSTQQVTGFFRRLSEYLGYTISPHRLRHSMATELARGRNPDLKGLQHLLGHTDLRTTLQYVHPDHRQLQVLLGQLPTL
ncbi:MAG TPA: site-specific integrase [Gammaproteobacteria bacterium]|nr:site-specific integrase [Gammaproteobacteria bacterium]